MSNYETRFWKNCARYHDLAEQVDRNIERVHPGAVTSKRMCDCLEFTAWCAWGATNVDYLEYRGESI